MDSNLTYAEQLARRVIVLHEEDLQDPIVKIFRDGGFELDISGYAPKGNAYFQTPEKCGVIDFKAQTAVCWENTETKFTWAMPEWPKSEAVL